jgi:hypothetical protein
MAAAMPMVAATLRVCLRFFNDPVLSVLLGKC